MPGHQLLCAEERESMSIRNVPINVKPEEMGKGKGGGGRFIRLGMGTQTRISVQISHLANVNNQIGNLFDAKPVRKSIKRVKCPATGTKLL